MEVLMSVTAGIMFSVATYLILSRSLLRIVLGTTIITHAVHLLLMTMSGLKTGSAPLIDELQSAYVDPLPQALILTSIVISFGVTAFLLVLIYRAYQELGTEDMELLRGDVDE